MHLLKCTYFLASCAVVVQASSPAGSQEDFDPSSSAEQLLNSIQDKESELIREPIGINKRLNHAHLISKLDMGMHFAGLGKRSSSTNNYVGPGESEQFVKYYPNDQQYDFDDYNEKGLKNYYSQVAKKKDETPFPFSEDDLGSQFPRRRKKLNPAYQLAGVGKRMDHSMMFSGLGKKMDNRMIFSGLGKKMDHNMMFSGLGKKMDHSMMFSGLGKKMDHNMMFSGLGKKMDHNMMFSGLGKKMDNAMMFSGLGKKMDKNMMFSGLGKRMDNAMMFSGLGKKMDPAFQLAGVGKRMDQHMMFSGLGKKMDPAFQLAGVGKRMDQRMMFSGLGKKMDHSMMFSGLGKKMDPAFQLAGVGKKMDHRMMFSGLGKKSDSDYQENQNELWNGLEKKLDPEFQNADLGQKMDQDELLTELDNKMNQLLHLNDYDRNVFPQNSPFDKNQTSSLLSDSHESSDPNQLDSLNTKLYQNKSENSLLRDNYSGSRSNEQERWTENTKHIRNKRRSFVDEIRALTNGKRFGQIIHGYNRRLAVDPGISLIGIGK